MRGKAIRHLIGIVALNLGITLQSGRSVWRPKDPLLPEIKVNWEDNGTESFYLGDNCLEYHAIFCKFNKEDFYEHLIPNGPISYRNHPEQTVDSEELSRIAENVIKEIRAHKKTYTDFTVLKKSDFNTNLGSGLIILKYKKYPFVLKLFLKTPETFVKRNEGIVPKFLFRMGGGTNRHLSGFTRISNLEKIQKRINKSPKYSQLIELPRKWYWAPKNMRWLTIRGNNIGCNGPCETTLPAEYGIIVDAIDAERQFKLSSNEDCKFALEFSAYIGNRMDAHVDNLLLEKETGKILIIDTEHFPTMVGLKEPITFDNYKSWYLQLSGKCFKDNFMRDKNFRRELQTNPRAEIYALYKEETPAAAA